MRPKDFRMATIRIAVEGDLPAVLAVGKQTPWEKTGYLKCQLNDGNVAVAEEDGVVCGFIVWNREFFSLPFIWLVAVAVPHRGRGIASELMAFVEDECGPGRLYSSTNESNEGMHRLFARRGYRRAGTADVDPGDLEVFYRVDLPERT